MSDWKPWITGYRGPGPARKPDIAERMVLMATFDRGEHVCACAYLGENAPCGHCVYCPVCNCARCEDWHDTAGGEICPHITKEETRTMRKIDGQWFNPVSWFYLPTDWKLAVRWGKDDAEVPDPESQELALGNSLCLLHPLTHRRYWAAYRAAGGEIEP